MLDRGDDGVESWGEEGARRLQVETAAPVSSADNVRSQVTAALTVRIGSTFPSVVSLSTTDERSMLSLETAMMWSHLCSVTVDA